MLRFILRHTSNDITASWGHHIAITVSTTLLRAPSNSLSDAHTSTIRRKHCTPLGLQLANSWNQRETNTPLPIRPPLPLHSFKNRSVRVALALPASPSINLHAGIAYRGIKDNTFQQTSRSEERLATSDYVSDWISISVFPWIFRSVFWLHRGRDPLTLQNSYYDVRPITRHLPRST